MSPRQKFSTPWRKFRGLIAVLPLRAKIPKKKALFFWFVFFGEAKKMNRT